MLQLLKQWFTIIGFLLSCNVANAQQWVQKSYNYDSTYSVVYGTATNFAGGTDTLRMDIYTPVCDNNLPGAKRPLAIFIHGGAFLGGERNNMTWWCKEFAKRGYVTATITYRLGMVSDENAWDCIYPNYRCLFATDTAEWYRSSYRAIQDAKGAIRYFVNRNAAYQIDVNNIFVSGESAGAITALGVALLDTISEKPSQAFALESVAKPNANTLDCLYNNGKTFQNTIARPDLGSIDGNIEPSTIPYTIIGVGNLYGATISNFLTQHKFGVPLPAIYSFHQPCDIIVPFEQGRVMGGLSWCFTNGYNCYAVANTPLVLGSKAISDLNTQNAYGYTILNEFTSKQFPYSFLFGEGSCLDQVNNACHALDNATLRENNLAAFFATKINITTICPPQSIALHDIILDKGLKIYPNPCSTHLWLEYQDTAEATYQICDILGKILAKGKVQKSVNEIVLGYPAQSEMLIFTLITSKSTYSKIIQCRP